MLQMIIDTMTAVSENHIHMYNYFLLHRKHRPEKYFIPIEVKTIDI